MTLVVCRKSGDNNLNIHSDSKVIDEFGSGIARELRQNLPLIGLLKTVILHPHVCLSFAGHSLHATDFLKNFFSENLENWDTERLLKALFEVNIKSKQQCEFILCLAFGRVPTIFTVKNGQIKEELHSAWIGSRTAFSAYQEKYHESDTLNTSLRMKEAFRSVIVNAEVYEVGHFHIEAYLDHRMGVGGAPDSVFLYEDKMELDTGSQFFHLKAGVATTMQLGRAEFGAYGTSYFRSVSVKRQGVAIYFPHSDFGILMCPQVDCEKPIIITGDTAEEFLRIIADDYKIALEGFSISDGSRFKLLRSDVTHDEP